MNSISFANSLSFTSPLSLIDKGISILMTAGPEPGGLEVQAVRKRTITVPKINIRLIFEIFLVSGYLNPLISILQSR
jgi:hypothetical protein